MTKMITIPRGYVEKLALEELEIGPDMLYFQLRCSEQVEVEVNLAVFDSGEFHFAEDDAAMYCPDVPCSGCKLVRWSVEEKE